MTSRQDNTPSLSDPCLECRKREVGQDYSFCFDIYSDSLANSFVFDSTVLLSKHETRSDLMRLLLDVRIMSGTDN
jgi:hypothetical protein